MIYHLLPLISWCLFHNGQLVYRGWVSSFLKRHKELLLEKSVILEAARFKACCRANLLPFYERFESIVRQYGIQPSLLFSLDETNTNFARRNRSKIIVSRSAPVTVSVAPDRTNSATLVLCIPAEGRSLDCTLIWPQANIPTEFQSFPIKGIRTYLQKTSYQTCKSFDTMMIDYYLPAMIERRHTLQKDNEYILLIMDGHITRMSVRVIHYAMQNRILILILPSHTSSVSQPLDRAPNATLKQVFTSQVSERLIIAEKSSEGTETYSSDTLRVEDKKTETTENTSTDPMMNDELEEEEEGRYPPLPAEIIDLPGRNKFLGSASANRQLLQEVLPIAIESATRYSVMSAGWKKSGLFPYNPGAMLTERAKLIEICRYKETRIVGEIRKTTTEGIRKEMLTKTLKEIRELKSKWSTEGEAEIELRSSEVRRIDGGEEETSGTNGSAMTMGRRDNSSTMMGGREKSSTMMEQRKNPPPPITSLPVTPHSIPHTTPSHRAEEMSSLFDTPPLPIVDLPSDSSIEMILKSNPQKYSEMPKRLASEEQEDSPTVEIENPPVPVPRLLRRSGRQQHPKRMAWDMMGW